MTLLHDADNNQAAKPLESLPKHYDAAAMAAFCYPMWQSQGFFAALPIASKPPFCVVIPPPNVTGSLHMGHALNQILQDVMVRYRRMQGYNVAWIPGYDHASIAVHWVLEKALHAEGLSKQSLGRERFLARAQAFKEETQQNIERQQKKLGISCDWQRTRFTLDEGNQIAVREMFARLYADGLIYRKQQLVQWDPVAQTTVSDLEVVYREDRQAKLWTIFYPLADDDSMRLAVSTTRPETLLGDTAVAVHPEDSRYRHWIGKQLRHPLTKQTLPIVADAELVDPNFGSGAVKITPGHDFRDFALAQRHGLPCINLLNRDGTLNEAAGAYQGKTIAQARTQILADLAALGLLGEARPYVLQLACSERSGAVLQPYLSTQWYIRCKPLARPAIAAVERGLIRFMPKSWENTYFAWMYDIHDWCISRQLWWGHRIPAWHCQACQHITVSHLETVGLCERCQSTDLCQDEDVLDTWFSSAMWAYSSLGWPNATVEMAHWYPTALLVTGFDIIFFWVARMIMFSLYATGEIPFRQVLIHPLIRDAAGEKMSKTKGNVVDPLNMIDKYGVDAFRFAITGYGGQSSDIKWNENTAEHASKFCNKLWQALRFVRSMIPSDRWPTASASSTATPTMLQAWLHAELGKVVATVNTALQALRLDIASQAISQFAWEIYCDWYLEAAKVVLRSEVFDETQKQQAYAGLVTGLRYIAQLLAPIMPFLAEALWQNLPDNPCESVHQSSYPAPADFAASTLPTPLDYVFGLVQGVRRMRADYIIAPKQVVEVALSKPLTDKSEQTWFEQLSKAKLVAPMQLSKPYATLVWQDCAVMLGIGGLLDVAQERLRLQKMITSVQVELMQVEAWLAHPEYVQRAPAAVVTEKQTQQSECSQRLHGLREALERLL